MTTIASILSGQGALTWRPHLSPVLSGILILLLAAWAVHVCRRMRTRMSKRRTALLLVPKLLAILLLLIALFDPLWSRTISIAIESRILTVLDVSSSMDVHDADNRSRVERAEAVRRQLREKLPASLDMTAWTFDTALHKSNAPPANAAPPPDAPIRGTDLGGALYALCRDADLSSYAAAVFFTDGGDEAVDAAQLPDIPVHVVGIGGDSDAACDLAIADLVYPATLEKDTDFEIAADLTAQPGNRPADAFTRVTVTLETQTTGAWHRVDAQTVNLANRRARIRFKTSSSETGLNAYRVTIARQNDEISALNNTRTIAIDVQRKSLHVLFFTREIGAGLKMLRTELAPDPGITFTALYRTIGERFTVQGQRQPGDEELDAGFPPDKRVLELFDCIILGAYPGGDWRPDQIQALIDYTEQGGAVVFLGGDAAFTTADPAGQALAPLLPWQPATARDRFLLGRFPVSIPPAAANPIVAGVGDALGAGVAPVIESVNQTGQLKPGATSLLNVTLDGRAVALAAVQRYGKGGVLAIASNTFWKWARESDELRRAYGLFWRQAVRDLTGAAEGGRILTISWNKPFYRPGEQAVLGVRIAGESSRNLQLTAALAFEGRSRPIAVQPVQGRGGEYEAKVLFEHRGTHTLSLEAREGEQLVETYEKALAVGPLLPEGAKLQLNAPALAALAKRAGGIYVGESEVDKLANYLAARHLSKSVQSDTSIVSHGPWYAAAFLVILILEWILRRAMNLY